MAKRWPLTGMLLAAMAAGCGLEPTVAPSIAELPRKVEPAALDGDATLALTVKAAPPPPEAGYRTQYLDVVDWEVADASLTNTDPAIPSLSRTVAATVDASLGRQATLYFAPVKATGNYTLTITLKRRDRTGSYQAIATGTKANFSLSSGGNTAVVTLAPTASGQLVVSVPQPAPWFSPPPSVAGLMPTTGSVGMLATVTGTNFGDTIGSNGVLFNGTSAPLSAATSTAVTAQVPAGATTGPLMVQAPYWPAVGAGTFTVVASGTTFGTFGVGASPDGMACDSAGNIWVANSGGTTVSKLAPDGTLLATYSVGASAPFALAFDGAGTLWIGTYTNPGQVVRMAPDGTILGTTTAGNNVADLALDASGNCWISNNGDNTISKLTGAGAFVANYTIGVNPSQASGLAIDGAGNVWVGVYNRGKIVKLAPNGTTLGTYTVGNNPAALRFDAAGALWATMEGDSRLYKMATDGSITATYATNTGPRGLAIDSLGDPWVCSVGSTQLTKHAPSGAILGSYPMAGQPNSLCFDRTRAAWVSIQTTNSVVKLAL